MCVAFRVQVFLETQLEFFVNFDDLFLLTFMVSASLVQLRLLVSARLKQLTFVFDPSLVQLGMTGVQGEVNGVQLRLVRKLVLVSGVDRVGAKGEEGDEVEEKEDGLHFRALLYYRWIWFQLRSDRTIFLIFNSRNITIHLKQLHNILPLQTQISHHPLQQRVSFLFIHLPPPHHHRQLSQI